MLGSVCTVLFVLDWARGMGKATACYAAILPAWASWPGTLWACSWEGAGLRDQRGISPLQRCLSHSEVLSLLCAMFGSRSVVSLLCWST